jgi:hypothetical protein
MTKKLRPYTDKIPEPPHGEPNGEHVGHLRIIVFDQHTDDGEMRFGVDIALEPEQASRLSEYIARDEKLFSIMEAIFGSALRHRLSDSIDELFGSMFGSHHKVPDAKPKVKIPDGMGIDEFAALMREAFNGETCDCSECRAVREKRIGQKPRNTDPASN